MSPTPAGPDRGSWRALLVLLAIAAAPKLAVLLAPRPDLYLAGSLGLPQTWHGEEIHRGTTAVELLEGPTLDFFDYTYAPFFGGSLVLSVLAVPLFAVLGTSLVVLKLVPLAFHLASVAALWLAAGRFWGSHAAFLAGLLLAIATPGYTVHTLTAFGTHVESNALAMALLAGFVAIWWRFDGRRPRLGAAFAWGVLAGFAIYFGYIVALTLAALAFARFVVDKRFLLRRDGLAAVAGFVVGLAPWIAYNAAHDFEGLAIYGRPIAGAAATESASTPAELGAERPNEPSSGRNGPATDAAGEPSAGARVAGLLVRGFPRSAFFRDLGPIDGRVLDAAHAILVVLLALGVLWHDRRLVAAIARALFRSSTSRAVPPFAPFLLVQPVLFVIAFAATRFRVGDPPDAVVSYRYVHVVWPWLYAAAAVTLVRGIAGGGARARLALGAVVLLAAMGLAGTLQLVRPSQCGRDLDTPAYSYVAFGRFVVMSFDRGPAKILAAIDRAEEKRTSEDLDAFLFGMGMQLKEALRPIRSAGPRLRAFRERAADLRARVHAHVAPRFRPYFEAPRPGEPSFGQMGKDARAEFWEWRRAAGEPPEPADASGG